MWINQCRNIWTSYSKLLHFRDSLSDAMIIINFVSGSFVVFASSEVDRSAHRQTHTCTNTHTRMHMRKHTYTCEHTQNETDDQAFFLLLGTRVTRNQRL